MINLKKYSFKKYSKKFPKLFDKEKRFLKKILSRAQIEHVGSTAVPELGGKGIIDIAIAVPKNSIKDVIKKLQQNRFEYKLSGGSFDRKFFCKIIRYDGEERRVHLQLTHTNSKVWHNMIAVRNYLRKNKTAAIEYTKVKEEAVKFAEGEGKRYRSYKNTFLKRLQKNALKEYYSKQDKRNKT